MIKEVHAKRFTGPYEEVPFEYFIQSPIRWVPKDGGLETRLIFHLSHPKGGTFSVNTNTPKELCTVEYSDFDEAVRICLNHVKKNPLQPIFVAKSDFLSAFRNLGLHLGSWLWTVLKAQSPF